MANSVTIRIKNSSNDTGEYFDASETSISAPDSGGLSLEKNVDSASDGAAFFAVVLFVVALALGIMVLKWWRRRRVGFNYDKRITNIVMIFAILVGAGFAIGFYKVSNGNNKAKADFNDDIEVNAEDVYMEADVSNGPAYVTQKSTVTVKDESGNGYTLLAFVEGDDALQLEGGSGEIANLESKEYSTNLEENTWGLATKSPNSLSSKVFRGLENDGQKAVIVDYHDGSLSAIEKTIDVYYGAYLTPDLSEGTYVNRKVNFVAVANEPARDDFTINFYGNGTYFDEAHTQEINTVVYGKTCRRYYEGKDVRIVKSDNLSDDGTQQPSSGYNGTEGEHTVYPVRIPGADGLKVKIKYGLTAIYSFNVFEGLPNEAGELPAYDSGYMMWDKTSTNDNIAGEEEFSIDGDAVTFDFMPYSSPEEGFDYGFFATITPLYEYEREENNTTRSCWDLDRKFGEYKDLINDDTGWYQMGRWLLVDEILIYHSNPSTLMRLNSRNEKNLIYWLKSGIYDDYRGRPVYAYVEYFYTIRYDSNGGTGDMDDNTGVINSAVWLAPNAFTRDGYQFDGWNTEPDGSGREYSSMVTDYMAGGTILTLYAQWRPITNP